MLPESFLNEDTEAGQYGGSAAQSLRRITEPMEEGDKQQNEAIRP